jgi:RNA methyltransferase, TrmH family
MIISITNQKVKDAVKLRSSSARGKNNLFIFEGAREIMLALSGGIVVTDLFVCMKLCKDLENQAIVKAKESNVNIEEVTEKVYDKLSYGNRRDGVVAVAKTPSYELTDIKLNSNSLIVVADGIEKPGNLGAMLRTVDACAVDSFIVCDTISDVYNHHVVRSSVGTVFAKPVVSASSKDIYAWLKKNNISIVCADPDGLSVYTSVDLKGPIAIVLGNEKKGVSCFWKENADFISFIPMKGKADSLNVSITAAAFIFEAVKQRS